MPAIPIVIRRVATKACHKLGALILFFMLWFCFPINSYAVSQSVLTGIQVSTVANSNSPQVSLSFNDTVDYKVFTLPNPNRLVVDLKYCRAGIKTNQIDLSNSPIAKVRIGIQNGVNLRVVFDLTQAMHPNTLPSNNASGERIDIALNGGNVENVAAAGGIATEQTSTGNIATEQMSAGNTGNVGNLGNAGTTSEAQMAAASASASSSTDNETVRTSTAVRSADISMEQTTQANSGPVSESSSQLNSEKFSEPNSQSNSEATSASEQHQQTISPDYQSTQQNSASVTQNNSSNNNAYTGSASKTDYPTSKSRIEQMSIAADLNYQVGSTTVTRNGASATQENEAPNGATNNANLNPNLNSNQNSNQNPIENSNVTAEDSSNPSAAVATTEVNSAGNNLNNNIGNVASSSSSELKNSNYNNDVNAANNDVANNDHNNVDVAEDETNHFYASHLTRTIFSAAVVDDRPVIVVIDPGHGGKDPGATGPMGLHEKTVTLEIAEDLKRLIDKQKGMHAVLTRSGDYYVGLRDRLAIARKDRGDMFIAIHADAAPAISGYEATGATVYALSLHGASSEAARWIAEKENYSELGGIDLDTIQDSDNMLRSVLIDLSQTATISDSLILGRSVLHQLSDLSPLHHDVVEQAPFMVLKSPDIPSILVETGYITNPQEETHLRDPLYQQELAHAMLSGINSYFMHYAPPGSWLASNHEALKDKYTRNI